MTGQPRRPYRVRFRKALAGSAFVAAAAASLTGITAAPARAAPPTRVATAPAAHSGAVQGIGMASLLEDALLAVMQSDVERPAGVRTDLDRAVLLRLVTPEQADAFYAQIERRVAAGL